jgi:dipeptidase
MASDMAVALARATLDGHTYFAHNSNRPRGEAPALVRTVGRDHAPGEKVQATHVSLPQAKKTFGVLAGRAGHVPGYQHGVNEKGVAAGCTPIRTRLLNDAPCLTGPDLVQLALERASSALQAVEVVTDLIGRHGQGPFVGEGEDSADAALLIADCREAYVLEATGRHWARASIGSVRAVSDACFLHQDWDRISRGLSDLAIHRGWWPEDGCKLDFARALGQPGTDLAPAMRRWGQATMELEQHSGTIDGAFLRRLLRLQAESVCPTDGPPAEIETAASLIVRLGPEPGSLPAAWYAFGPPPVSVYLPVLPVAELPAAYCDDSSAGSPLWRILGTWHDEGRQDSRTRPALLTRLAELQQELDEQAHEFLAEAEDLHRRGQADELRRLAAAFMQHTCDCFEELECPTR